MEYDDFQDEHRSIRYKDGREQLIDEDGEVEVKRKENHSPRTSITVVPLVNDKHPTAQKDGNDPNVIPFDPETAASSPTTEHTSPPQGLHVLRALEFYLQNA